METLQLRLNLNMMILTHMSNEELPLPENALRMLRMLRAEGGEEWPLSLSLSNGVDNVGSEGGGGRANSSSISRSSHV